MSSLLLQLAILGASAAAIAALVWLNSRLGGWTPASLDALETARAALEADVIGFKAGEGVLADDGRAALFTERAGDRLGLVAALGDGLVTRALGPGELRAAQCADAKLSLRLNDYTFTRIEIALGDRVEAETWRARAEALMIAPGPAPAIAVR